MVLEVATLAWVIQATPSPSGNADLPNAQLLTLSKLGLLNGTLKSCTWLGEEASKQECTLQLGFVLGMPLSIPRCGFGVPLRIPGVVTTAPASKCSFSHNGSKFRQLKKCLHPLVFGFFFFD